MNKKFIGAVLIFALTLNCAGCSGTWRRKFIRKKKGEDKQGPVLQPHDYKKEFSYKQLYANHFAFWKNSESELISSIKANKSEKRVRTQASYSLTEIKKLHDLLIEDKQKELTPFVEQLNNIVTRLYKPNYISSHKNVIVRELIKHYRAVDAKFSYFYMKKYVKADE